MRLGILRRLLGWFALASIVLVLLGCGSGSSSNVSSVPLQIIQQPQNATIPLDQSATFSVIAVGTGALSYQWSSNGTAIQGATAASYTTPPVTVGDTGEKFTVTVQDNKASVTSNIVVLTVGPRSPAAGDLRFKQVDAPSTAGGFNGLSFHYLEYPFGATYQNVLGFPLRLGSGTCVAGVAQDCAWFYEMVPVSTQFSLSVGYLPDKLENLDSDLSTDLNTNAVVTSLDLRPDNDVFAMSWMQGPATGFDYKHEVVPLRGLSALVANDGANGRVVTAISFDASGGASLLSYGWASDQTTVYDTTVATASYNNITAQATALANAGYIITAFGGDPTWGYVMVGTRVHGDSMPRPILTFPPTPSATPVNNYALVGYAQDLSAGNDSTVWIFEK